MAPIQGLWRQLPARTEPMLRAPPRHVRQARPFFNEKLSLLSQRVLKKTHGVWTTAEKEGMLLGNAGSQIEPTIPCMSQA